MKVTTSSSQQREQPQQQRQTQPIENVNKKSICKGKLEIDFVIQVFRRQTLKKLLIILITPVEWLHNETKSINIKYVNAERKRGDSI